MFGAVVETYSCVSNSLSFWHSSKTKKKHSDDFLLFIHNICQKPDAKEWGKPFADLYNEASVLLILAFAYIQQWPWLSHKLFMKANSLELFADKCLSFAHFVLIRNILGIFIALTLPLNWICRIFVFEQILFVNSMKHWHFSECAILSQAK